MPEQTPAAPSPEALSALKSLEQKQLQPVVNNQSPVISNQIKPAGTEPRWLTWLKGKNMWVKIAVGFGSVIFLCLLSIALVYMTSVDLRFTSITLAGQVIDASGNPVADAQVKLDDIERTTDAQGNFSIPNLELKRYRLVINHNAFQTYDEEIAVSRGFFNYTDSRKFTLVSAKSAILKGRFIPSSSSYQFIGEKIQIDDVDYDVRPNGTFEVNNLKSGKINLVLNSDDYEDVSLDLELAAGINQIEDINLTPAGDIKASSTSWVRGDVIKNASIEIEGVAAEQITIAEDGELRIRDLEVGKSYNIRTKLAGYQDRDYVITIEQGINELPQFRFVESGRVPYIRKVDRDMYLFVSDYDGKNEKQLTNTIMEPYGEFIKDEVVYFLSTRDNVQSSLDGDALLAYASSISGGNPQRLTTSTTNIGKITPNFTAAKLTNVWAPVGGNSQNRNQRTLEVMDLTGTSRQTIKQIPAGTFGDTLISDSGKYIVYYVQNQEHTIDGLYRADLTESTINPVKLLNKRNTLIYALSADGNRIVYSATNDATGLVDLFIYTVSNGQDKTLKQSFAGTNFQFLRGSDSVLLFKEQRDGGSNVYSLDTNSNQETKLTSFRGSEGVEAVYQQGRYVMYQTNLGLYIMDATKPVTGRQVTDKAARYTGYDF